MSIALCTAFGRDTEGAAWTVYFLLEKILSNLTQLNSEAGVVEDTIRLLVSLADCKEKCQAVLKSPGLLKLVELATRQERLPARAKRGLLKALVLVGAAQVILLLLTLDGTELLRRMRRPGTVTGPRSSIPWRPATRRWWGGTTSRRSTWRTQSGTRSLTSWRASLGWCRAVMSLPCIRFCLLYSGDVKNWSLPTLLSPL